MSSKSILVVCLQGIVAELVAAMSHDLEIVGSSLGSGVWKGCVIILAIVPNIRVSAWIYDVQIVQIVQIVKVVQIVLIVQIVF